MARVKLGEKYRDPTSGFTGIADARCEYLKGTPQVRLVAPNGPNKVGTKEWFYEGLLEQVVDRRAGFGS